MIGNRTSQPTGEISVDRMEGQERHHRSVEVLDVLGLGFIPASSIGIFPLGIAFGGPLDFEFGTNLIDGGCRCPNAS